jgi:hypothetical protein
MPEYNKWDAVKDDVAVVAVFALDANAADMAVPEPLDNIQVPTLLKSTL